MLSTNFKKLIWAHYKKHGRHTLPWRKTHDPYRILVSEIMLQQTQVDRVIPKYEAFLKKFPNVRALARAPLGDVLRAWQGLGYNRRAKFLHEAAKAIAAQGWPKTREELTKLSGIGPYTASAIRTFAYDEPSIFIETNIRTVFIHHFFPRAKKVSDKAIIRYIVQSLPRRRVREWYWALMDYGSYLKKTEGNASLRSAHHTKQKPFKGSDREVRGAILRALSQNELPSRLPFPKKRIETQLKALSKEGLIAKKKNKFVLP